MSKKQKPTSYRSMALLAHVDAGKTTLSEAMLYLGGALSKPGRVDHQDTLLDTHDLERKRGITIFSKEAILHLSSASVTILDTPGHVDFSAETERVLSVLDVAVLVISGADGVQGHTKTLWNLLERYQVPTILFINKMDQEGTDREKLLQELGKELSAACVSSDEIEDVASCSETALEEYLETGTVSTHTRNEMIRNRELFPCFFGSALKQSGVEELLEELTSFFAEPDQGGDVEDVFRARVFKISRTAKGERLTHLKVLSGVLKVKDELQGKDENGEWSEKVHQIRLYSGDKYELAMEANPGQVCEVTGLTRTQPGNSFGVEEQGETPVLKPVLSYRVLFSDSLDVHDVLAKLRILEEEEPLLSVSWEEELSEIYVTLMGEVQTEILQSLLKERYDMEVTFGEGHIVYKETVTNQVEGVGHFEPLRHYAEVHLLLEPGEPGSGITIDTICSENALDRNYQRLILSHVLECDHPGVLLGAPLADVKITLAAGKAHAKHTEGGDFREATYRAIRQGLKKAQCEILEPYYAFELEIPRESVGRAMTDLQVMHADFAVPQGEGDSVTISGTVPVATIRNYQKDVLTYTRGLGRLHLAYRGYFPAHNREELLQESGYDADHDVKRPCGSIFCSHGAGYYVPWDQVEEKMHIPAQLAAPKKKVKQSTPASKNTRKSEWNAEEKELEEIFIRTYGKVESKTRQPSRKIVAGSESPGKKKEQVPEFLLVDGYNVIFAWDELKELANDNLEAARGRLIDILSNYQGYKKCTVILVFDAYKVEGFSMEVQKIHNIHVVYTKQAETADQYIERVVHQTGKKYHVTVVTSDGLEQMIARAQGSDLLSSREFRLQVEAVGQQIREDIDRHRTKEKNRIVDHIDDEMVKNLEEE